MSIKVGGIDGGEVDFVFEFFSDRVEFVVEFSVFFFGFSEDVGEGDVSGYVVRVGFRVDFVDEGSGSGFGESFDGFGVEFFFVDVFVFVERFVEDDGRGFDIFSFGNFGVVDIIEEVGVVEFFSNVGEGFVGGFVVRGDVGD